MTRAGIDAAAARITGRVRRTPVLAPTLYEALAAGGPIDVPVAGVAVDSRPPRWRRWPVAPTGRHPVSGSPLSSVA